MRFGCVRKLHPEPSKIARERDPRAHIDASELFAAAGDRGL